jgi:hypothetical protein
MPIPAELTSYNNEADFRERFVIPLLHRLGFSVVTNFHGQREFGKDVVFAEVDRWGQVAYHGLQAKFVDSISQGGPIRDLIIDAEEAYANPFTHPQTGASHRISDFFAVNGGTIPDNAREHFFNTLQPKFGANVRLIDGLGLLSLDRWAAFNRGSFIKERIIGLLLELQSNRSQGNALTKALTAFVAGSGYPLARLRLPATLAVLEQPLILEDAFINTLQGYWHYARSVNDLIDAADTVLNVPDYVKLRVNTAIELISKLDESAQIIEVIARARLLELGSTVAAL